MSQPLIDAAALSASLASAAPPVVLDVRYHLGDGGYGVASYRAGHIPGAVFADLDRDLAAPAGSGPGGSGGRHPLPSAESFQAAMRVLGVRDTGPVVVYDDGESVPAARAWWTLRYFGHADVRVLDGGYRAWQAGSLPVTSSALALASGDFTARPGQMPTVDAAGAAALARDGLLIDVRAGERYRGETEPIDPIAGHIPGAVNVPVADTGHEDGTFKDPATLSALFKSLPAPGSPAAAGTGIPAVGAYCGSGVTAARGVLALDLAGIPAALYVGSWSDWIQDPTRPLASQRSAS
ncbi:MAG TPA: sulfurtransferase [Streptosporangiaceae bacterium]|nr:sulfurtransferase [Streptosporangiaceae bacterium]